MSKERISMVNIRELLRLYEEKQTKRQIARALNISRNAVKKYLENLLTQGLRYEAVKDMPDDKLLELITGLELGLGVGVDKKSEYQKLASRFPKYVLELKKTGVTLQELHNEYLKDYPDGYGYSQFCYHFQTWRKAGEITMHIEHKAGEKMFCDFTGDKLKIIDRITGEEIEVEVFVAILCTSQLMYVEAAESQTKENWIKLNQNAFRYFNGVPKAVVPDNLKAAVIKADQYEPDINPEYFDFARHYGTVILPARPDSAKDKALAEGAVRISYLRIFAPLRNRVFHSIAELNEAIWELLEKSNNMPMQKLNISRRQLYEETEKQVLKPLPVELYKIRKFKVLTVQFNYHIELREDYHYYSVPYQYRRKQVSVIYTDSVVEIFLNNQRIAFHKRIKKCGYSTIPEHMPQEHRFYAEWSPERIIGWAEKIGENTKILVTEVFNKVQYPEQAFKSCLGILSLGRKYDNLRLENACSRAIGFKIYSYKVIKNILERGLDKLEKEPASNAVLPQHENIRGKTYYN